MDEKPENQPSLNLESSEEELIRIRKDKLINFFKKNFFLPVYFILAIIIYLSVRIRTINIPGLKDISTGTWTLGPDLDPFLFLRLAQSFIEHGSFIQIDFMRYVPLGFNMAGEFLLHPFMIVYFHKLIATTLLGSDSLTYSAIIYPVFMFALTTIAFFFLTKEIFFGKLGIKTASIIALIASFFLVVMPSLLPRTIAGIPEKESVGFLFIFLSLYFFIAAWNRNNKNSGYIFAILAGISTAAMAHIWGGFIYIYFTILPAAILAFLLGQFDKRRKIYYLIWFFVSLTIIISIFYKYTIKNYLSSQPGAFASFILLILAIDFVISKTKASTYFHSGRLGKISPRLISVILATVTSFIFVTAIFGFSYISSLFTGIYNTLTKPPVSRLIQTVAENRKPDFKEWASSFGPNIKNIFIMFWLMFLGSIYLFYNTVRNFDKKDRRNLTIYFVLAASSAVFTNNPFLLLPGIFISAVLFAFFYFKNYNTKSEKFKEINFGILVFFFLYFVGVASAKAGVRFIMVLVPAASILTAYFVVSLTENSLKTENKNKIIALILSLLVITAAFFAGYTFYKESNAGAQGFVPSIYTQQWQKAMSWVKENTPQTAVFGHWWDYGYWLQSIGERATVLDGGNAIGYWNHFMGRYALTGSDNTEALEFLYAHNTTHFLVDSTDIGKYSAFSLIGSDVDYDRASFIPTFIRDVNQVQERKNSTIFVYSGGSGVDEDIIYEQNGTKVYLPSGQAVLGAILIEKDSAGKIISNPIGIFVYNNQQFSIPLKYIHDGEFKDLGNGIESGVFFFPRLDQTPQGANIEKDGALFYLSKRTVKSQLARLYLYKEQNQNFKLVHSEDDFLVAQIKSQDLSFDSDFIFYSGFRGPIRIWEINYPQEIKFNEKYLNTEYPSELSRR